jgi:hypothetical protein
VLDALLDERSVTTAAGRVHLSVPATSRDATVLTIGPSLPPAVAEFAPGVVLRFLPESDEDPVAPHLPLELPRSEYRIGWHARLDGDPAHAGLRELVAERWRVEL